MLVEPMIGSRPDCIVRIPAIFTCAVDAPSLSERAAEASCASAGLARKVRAWMRTLQLEESAVKKLIAFLRWLVAPIENIEVTEEEEWWLSIR